MALIKRVRGGCKEQFYQLVISGMSKEQHDFVERKAREHTLNRSAFVRMMLNRLMEEEREKQDDE